MMPGIRAHCVWASLCGLYGGIVAERGYGVRVEIGRGTHSNVVIVRLGSFKFNHRFGAAAERINSLMTDVLLAQGMGWRAKDCQLDRVLSTAKIYGVWPVNGIVVLPLPSRFRAIELADLGVESRSRAMRFCMTRPHAEQLAREWHAQAA
jgi:hypothetical protein